MPINAIWASQVEHLVLRHCNDRIKPELFSVKPKTYTNVTGRVLKLRALQVKGNEWEAIKMRALQLPV